MKYKIEGVIEITMATEEIEAESHHHALEKYRQMWMNGDIATHPIERHIYWATDKKGRRVSGTY